MDNNVLPDIAPDPLAFGSIHTKSGIIISDDASKGQS